MGNHDICKLGLGTNTLSLCIKGLSNGDQEKSGRPTSVFSIYDNVGSRVLTAIRENILAGGFVDLDTFLDIFCYIMLALEYPRTSKILSRLEKPLKYNSKSWPKKPPQVEWGSF